MPHLKEFFYKIVVQSTTKVLGPTICSKFLGKIKVAYLSNFINPLHYTTISHVRLNYDVMKV